MTAAPPAGSEKSIRIFGQIMRTTTLRLGWALVCLSAGPLASAADYELGQGIPAGDFLFSGYMNVVAQAPNGGANALMLDDLSLFVAGRVNRWVNPFLEAEISSLTLAQQGDGPTENGHLVRERIYNDLRLSDTDTLRIGKILAPVGDWNLIHAAPLVPTTTQPLTTSRGFATYASGVSWLRETADTLLPDWQIYVQPGTEWFSRPAAVAPRQFRDVSGAHLNWNLGINDKFGLSVQHGTLVSSDETYSLVGANFRRRFGRLALESETTVARWSGGNQPRAHDVEQGIYVLADYTLLKDWHGIAEAEYFQDHEHSDPSRNILVGLTYKQRPAVIWKIEYVDQLGTGHDIPTGWQASFAVLF
jgi:hypothetical protein